MQYRCSAYRCRTCAGEGWTSPGVLTRPSPGGGAGQPGSALPFAEAAAWPQGMGSGLLRWLGFGAASSHIGPVAAGMERVSCSWLGYPLPRARLPWPRRRTAFRAPALSARTRGRRGDLPLQKPPRGSESRSCYGRSPEREGGAGFELPAGLSELLYKAASQLGERDTARGFKVVTLANVLDGRKELFFSLPPVTVSA